MLRATMAGPLRNGYERGGGTVAHLINSDDPSALEWGTPALCGRAPKIMWSEWAPEGLKTCPRCAAKAVKLTGDEK